MSLLADLGFDELRDYVRDLLHQRGTAGTDVDHLRQELPFHPILKQFQQASDGLRERLSRASLALLDETTIEFWPIENLHYLLTFIEEGRIESGIETLKSIVSSGAWLDQPEGRRRQMLTLRTLLGLGWLGEPNFWLRQRQLLMGEYPELIFRALAAHDLELAFEHLEDSIPSPTHVGRILRLYPSLIEDHSLATVRALTRRVAANLPPGAADKIDAWFRQRGYGSIVVSGYSESELERGSERCKRPWRVDMEMETATPIFARFSAQPFERGFGTTIGSSLRRCLLSSIEGAAITAVHIEGVIHEFSPIPGVVEDVADIILNLRQVPIMLESEEPKILSLDFRGPGTVSAGDFSGDSVLEILDPDLPIATLNEEGHLKLQAQVKQGRGYVTADRNFDVAMGIGWIPIDSVHNPVKRVNFRVEPARVGRATDYERLVLEIHTNGAVPPEEALSLASMRLRDHLSIFSHPQESRHEGASMGVLQKVSALDRLLAKSIDELDLSVRSATCLKNANIHNLRDLVRRTELEVLETKNLGTKSLAELQEVLAKLGLHLGMDVSERSPATLEAAASG